MNINKRVNNVDDINGFIAKRKHIENYFYKSCFSNPVDLTVGIFSYLEPYYLTKSCMCVCKKWQCVIKYSHIWDVYEGRYGILSRVVFNPSRILCERRSKGKIFLGSYFNSNRKDNDVVIRVIDLELTNAGFDDGLPTSALRECSYIQKLTHPFLLNYFGSQIIKNKLFIISEYIEYNLFNYMKTMQKYPLSDEVIRIFRDLIIVLDYIHKNGIVHRNIKPENIFVLCSKVVESGKIVQLKYNSLKLGDLCMSRFVINTLGEYTPEEPKERNRSWREARRMFYRAPELLLRCKLYGSNVDIWSAAIILFELACKEMLFNGSNEISFLWNIFATLGFPKHITIGSLPKELYLNWSSIINPWKGINTNDITRDVGVASEVDDYYTSTGQINQFRLLRKFYQIMGLDMLNLLLGMLNIDYTQRFDTKYILGHYLVNGVDKDTNDNTSIYPSITSTKSVSNPRPFRCVFPPLSSYQENKKYIVNAYYIIKYNYELSTETIHLALVYLDNIVNLSQIYKRQLYLTSIGCIKIADRFNEISQEYYKSGNSIEYSDIAATIFDDLGDIITPTAIVNTEKDILKMLNFNLFRDTLNFYIIELGRLLEFDIDSECHIFSLFVSNLSLYSWKLDHFPVKLRAKVIWLLAIYKYYIEDELEEESLNNTGNIIKLCRGDHLLKDDRTILEHPVLARAPFSNPLNIPETGHRIDLLNKRVNMKGAIKGREFRIPYNASEVNEGTIGNYGGVISSCRIISSSHLGRVSVSLPFPPVISGNSREEGGGNLTGGGNGGVDQEEDTSASCSSGTITPPSSVRDERLGSNGLSNIRVMSDYSYNYVDSPLKLKLERIMYRSTENRKLLTSEYSVWDTIQCMAQIEDLVFYKRNKMRLNSKLNSLFLIDDINIEGVMKVPLEAILVILDPKLHSQLYSLGHELYCRQFIDKM